MAEEPAAPAESPAPKKEPKKEPEKDPGPSIHVSPSPHLFSGSLTTQRMMVDVLIGLAPVVAMAVWVFKWYAVKQLGLCIIACMVFEAIFAGIRSRKATLGDCSALVTGVILALSLPWSAPWHVAVIASGAAIGLGKAVFGGLGQNLFNPAMVGRAFVMISFAGALGGSAYVADAKLIDIEILTQATPLTTAKMTSPDGIPSLWALFVGQCNGSLGEVSAVACLLGGLYLCLRRTASWEIPLGVLLPVALFGALASGLSGSDPALPILKLTALQHLLSGAVLFGAFFIATDPVSSPLTPKGKFAFGLGIGVLIMVLRLFSSYPEGVMFAVLLMNAVTPLLNRWTIPTPVGGPMPPPKPAPKA